MFVDEILRQLKLGNSMNRRETSSPYWSVSIDLGKSSENSFVNILTGCTAAGLSVSTDDNIPKNTDVGFPHPAH
jgi:hypothetical protein